MGHPLACFVLLLTNLLCASRGRADEVATLRNRIESDIEGTNSCLYPVLRNPDTVFFTLNGAVSTATPVPGALREYGVNSPNDTAENYWDTDFSTVFFKVGDNEIKFKSQPTDFLQNSNCLSDDHYVDIAVGVELSSPTFGSRVLLNEVYAGEGEFAWTMPLQSTLMELDPALAMDIANLEQQLQNYKANLVANAGKLVERDTVIAQKLDLIHQLEEELSTLFEESFDDFTAAELAEVLAQYPDLPKELTDGLLQVVRDLHKKAADLRAELETLMDNFAKKADSVTDLVTAKARDDGWNPNQLDNYGTSIFGNDVPQVAAPDVGSKSQFDPRQDPYDQVANDVIARLQNTLKDGRVADRAQYAAIVRAWRTNQRAIEDIIRERATVNGEESAAFIRAQDKVLEFVRHHMDPNDWFVDSPASPELKRLVDGVIRQRFAAVAQAIKDGVNLWTTRGPREQALEDMTVSMGSVLENGYDQEPDEVKGVVTRVLGWVSTSVQLGLGFTPVGDVIDACEAITGWEMCDVNGEQLQVWERVASGLGVVVGSGKFWQVVGSSVVGAKIASTYLAGVVSNPAVKKLREGSFNITSWDAYPSWAPKPTGTLRLLSGEEYEAARKAANAANAALRRADPGKYAGKQIHEILPVKFGGSPTDPANKIALSPADHAKLTTFWNQLMRDLQ
jgi:hypothetical protein